MFTRLKKLFTPPVPQVIEVEKVVYKVVEVKGPRIVQAWDKETKAAVATLQTHPGHIAVMDRLALQRQLLESKLTREYRKELREVDFLQSGVFWLGYVQELISKATNSPVAVYKDAMQEEMEAFRELDAKIERVGM